MTIERKFRAWEFEYAGTMHYSNQEHADHNDEDGRCAWLIDKKGIHIEIYNYDTWSDPDGRYMHLDVPKHIIMEYVGLKDNNSNEIYEGDILGNKWLCEVYKDKNTGAYMVRFHTNPKVNKPMTVYHFLKSRSKAGTKERDNLIIGNIHQNPELLK